MFSQVLFALAAISAVSAGGTGYAIRNDPAVTPCPPRFPVTQPQYAVALPADQFPTFEHCYSTVRISYQGKNFETVFTGLYNGGSHTQNITLNDAAFNILAPFPATVAGPGVVWNI